MTARMLLLSLVAGSMCVSCGSDAPPGSEANRRETLVGTADASKKSTAQQADREVRLPAAPIERPAVDGDAFGVGPAAPASADTSDMPLAPKDAQWTIYCATLAGPDHVETSRSLKSALVKRTKMREWYILHESGQSRIYYGFYRSIGDPQDAAESARAKGDRKKIDELIDGGGERPFRACQFVQLNAPDPESPPEWNLANAAPDKVWTLLIGAYKDHPDRKRAAVESVRDARAQGEEAYYFHGETVSNVFVGAWSEEAVDEERVDAKEGVGPLGPVLVLPPGMKAPGQVRRKGEAVRVVGQQLVPVDPELKKKIAQYPNMGVNGNFLVFKQNGRQRLQGSVIAVIPRPSETLFGADPAEPGDNPEGDGGFGGLRDPYRASGYDAPPAPAGRSPGPSGWSPGASGLRPAVGRTSGRFPTDGGR